MVDAFSRSERYAVDLYVADKQRNPFNAKRSKQHAVIPDLDVKAICDFAAKHKDRIDFGIVGPEKPIINGVRDLIEAETGIEMICPTKKYAIEASKVAQRQLFKAVAPELNPRFRVFDPKKYSGQIKAKEDLWPWLDELDNKVAVKPDTPVAGKGVGVWGDHFDTREALYDHFISNFENGPVIVEEKVEGEESSFQAFCDGRHLVPLPETRDYKRAFDDDEGPNTGGMGSYKGEGDILPFMVAEDREAELAAEMRIFEELKGRGSNPELRGVPCYDAFMHTGHGLKILERNSRLGDPESINLLPIIKDDFVDICLKMLDGRLRGIEVDKLATVVTYKVPMTYGGYAREYAGDNHVDLSKAEVLTRKYGDRIRIYPGSVELRDGECYSLGSRAVAILGAAEDIKAAREISLEGTRAVLGPLWNRSDIASEGHLSKSSVHMGVLRGSRG
jgi:phosphoribosylamine--glycine ligase